MKKLIATAVLALAAAAQASTATFRDIAWPVGVASNKVAAYNAAYGTSIDVDTPVEISTITNAAWVYPNSLSVFLLDNPGKCAEFDAALSKCTLTHVRRDQLPTVFSNQVAALAASGETSRRIAAMYKYGATPPYYGTSIRRGMSDADFFGCLRWDNVRYQIPDIFNVDGYRENRAEKLARRYLRGHGGFVGENGRQRVQEIVFALRDAFKTPRLAGVQGWFDQYAPELGVAFDWGFPPDADVEALQEKILDGDIVVRKDDKNYWLLYWYLGEQGFKDFFARYNGDQEAE